jgi:hypothetical protein
MLLLLQWKSKNIRRDMLDDLLGTHRLEDDAIPVV